MEATPVLELQKFPGAAELSWSCRTVLELQNYALKCPDERNKSAARFGLFYYRKGLSQASFESTRAEGEIMHPLVRSVTNYSVLQKRRDRLWSPPRLPFTGYRVLFSEKVQRADHEFDDSPLSSVEVKNGLNYIFSTIYVFMVYIGTTLTIPTPWSRVILEKLLSPRVVKKLPAFHRTRIFLAVWVY